MEFRFLKPLLKDAKTKIVFLVMDGIGGIPRKEDDKTELEAAFTPNLDSLASDGICGLQIPVKNGITPGSGPGHLSIFGYDPVIYKVGRGVLAANGINFDLKDGDVAARGNFCSIDEQGNVTDRRAGRISTDKNQELCSLLQENIRIPGVEVFVRTVKEHRFLLVLRGKNLSGSLHDTDPQQVGLKTLPPKATESNADYTVHVIDQFLSQSRDILMNHHPANMVLLRGFAMKPTWPTMKECYGLKCAAIAGYPMYRGVAKIIGMEILETGETIEDEFTTLEKHWNEYDFFYVHIKKTDSYGEDGDFEKKKTIIEEVDRYLPRLRALHPDVIVVTGDHSTPSKMAMHSWHPVPVLLWSEYCRRDMVKEFGERACISGALGPRFPAVDLMALALANARRLEKYGA